MRILNIICSTNSEHGGVIEWVRQYGPIAESLGHTVEVASFDRADDTWVKNFPITVHALGQKFSNFYSPQLVPWLKTQHHRYDLVIAHGLWRYASYGTWRALHTTNTPYFVYTHGMLDPWFKHKYPIKHMSKWLYWPWTDYRVLRDARGVIFTCEQEKTKARKSFWLYKANEIVASIGITSSTDALNTQRELFYSQYPATRNKRLILFLGRIHPKKGCDLVLNAFAKAALSTRDLHLIMAGPDNNDWVPTLKKIAKDLKISDRVTWTGMISGDLKWGAFQVAEAFVLPSHQENFGIAVVEAMACSLPVLISDKVDIFEEIKNDQAGLVNTDTQVGTDRLFSDWLRLTEEARYRMGQNALSCFRARFEVRNATKELLRLLQEQIMAPSRQQYT